MPRQCVPVLVDYGPVRTLTEAGATVSEEDSRLRLISNHRLQQGRQLRVFNLCTISSSQRLMCEKGASESFHFYYPTTGQSSEYYRWKEIIVLFSIVVMCASVGFRNMCVICCFRNKAVVGMGGGGVRTHFGWRYERTEFEQSC